MSRIEIHSLEAAEAGGLGSNAVGHASRSLGEHEPRAAKDGRVVFLLLLGLLSRLAFFVVFLERLDRHGLLVHVVDEEGLREVAEIVAPGNLHNDVVADEVVASIQHADVALTASDGHELSSDVSTHTLAKRGMVNLHSGEVLQPRQAFRTSQLSRWHP